MDKALRHALADALTVAFLVALAVGPLALLLWTWRRWGSRRRLALQAALLLSVVFAVCAAVDGAPHVIGRLRGPAQPGGFVPADHVVFKALKSGAAGVAFAVLFALAWVPVAAAWRWVHPASFRRVVRAGSGSRRSLAELDYGDELTADPGVEPDQRNRRT